MFGRMLRESKAQDYSMRRTTTQPSELQRPYFATMSTGTGVWSLYTSVVGHGPFVGRGADENEWVQSTKK